MREIQHVYALVERYAHGNYAPYNAPHLRPCVSRGVAPISTYCPYRARYLLNPVIGETQGVAALRSALPWAEIPLPLQGAAVSKPPNNEMGTVVLNRAPRFQNLRIMTGRWGF